MFRRLFEFLNQRKIGERNKLPQLMVGQKRRDEGEGEEERKILFLFSPRPISAQHPSKMAP